MPIAKPEQASSPIQALSSYSSLHLEDVSAITGIQSFAFSVSELSIEDVSVIIAFHIALSSQSELDFETRIARQTVNFISSLNSEIDVEIIQNYTEQLIPFEEPEAVDPGDSVGRLDSLELDFAISSTNPAFFKEFEYSGEDLVGFSIYTDPGKSTKIYGVEFIYSGEDLTTKRITRISDGRILTVSFNYQDGNLVSQNRSIS
jgi:hypothetical protein